ncbi:DUF1566 domain-containing protein [uncultured Thiothrix sp.]|uniref:Lcl C-terminal domain-containing protein n=1 Tax=uncultured Thiothrix sp. TaxID=223185 RepID=UPI00260D8262|nr:DUF1566 domain-containing protein [uncultured Thiothrix sp.]HMT92589.1 DUF1566 domain-containing protein [Thiolinea sp.]
MNKTLKTSFKQMVLTLITVGLCSFSTVQAAKNAKPIVDAGMDQTVYAGDLVSLAGKASDPENQTLLYSWIYPSKKISSVNITNANTLNPSFTAPDTTRLIQIQLAFTAFDPKQAKATDRVIITVKPKPIVPPPESITKINDTGVTSCGDYSRGHSGISNNDVVCQLLTDSNGDPVPTNQDGVSGRDINFPNDEDGRKGFSFTKLDAAGLALSSSVSQWSCVKDNVTGLVWELKTDDGGLHDKDDTYVWYESDPRLGNGGLPGYEKATDYDTSRNDQTCSGFSMGNNASYCNTKAFVNRVNQATYCGANNWRLPTREELNSLVDYQASPRIDINFFPNTIDSYYWTSVPYAYRNQHVWVISFHHGGGSPSYKHMNHLVRLVHD